MCTPNEPDPGAEMLWRWLHDGGELAADAIKFVRRLLSHLAGYCQQRDVELDDLTQEVLIKAWRTPPKDARNLAGWVMVIGRHHLYALGRSRTRRDTIVDTDLVEREGASKGGLFQSDVLDAPIPESDALDPAAVTLAAALSPSQRQLCQRALHLMPLGREADVVALRIRAWSCRRIAEFLGESEQNVNTNLLARGKREFLVCLDRAAAEAGASADDLDWVKRWFGAVEYIAKKPQSREDLEP